jgi:hypothetical protein
LIGLDSWGFAAYSPADFDEAGGIASGAARFFRHFRKVMTGGARGMGLLGREKFRDVWLGGNRQPVGFAVRSKKRRKRSFLRCASSF